MSAAIMNDGVEGRAAGRCAVGAVMGSKNLKAVSVIGTKRASYADDDAVKEAVKKWMKPMHIDTAGFREFGTSGGVATVEAVGDMPVKNWSIGNTDITNITGQSMAAKILKKPYHCAQCPIGCGRTVHVTEGEYASIETGGPEYETMGMLGSNCLINDLKAVQMGNELCNRYGLDTISAGSAVSFAMEAYEAGLLSEELLEGKKARWGNAEDMIDIIKALGLREGKLGDLLANGVKRASKMLGGLAEEMSVDVKGLEFPAHDPRASVATALQYVTSTRGADHLNSFTSDFTVPGSTPGFGFMPPTEMEPYEPSDANLNIVYTHQHVMAMMDSLTGCKFVIFPLQDNFMPNMLLWLKDVTGWEMTQEDFMKTGERLFNLKRMYQVKCGVSRKDDVLPPKMTKRRMTGGAANHIPNVAALLDRYYELRGWDYYGIPSADKLEDLGLSWLLDLGFKAGINDAYSCNSEAPV